MNGRVACAVLAAGASRRLGFPKQLALHHGVPLVRKAALCATHSGATESALIVGAHAAAVCEAISGLSLSVLDNPEWSEGIAASIRSAVRWAEQREHGGLLLVLCDQPRLTAAHLALLIERFERTGSAVASRYAGKNGVPAIFPRADFGALSALRGDTGAARLLNAREPVEVVAWPDGAFDVDTEDQMLTLLTSAPACGVRGP